jgi:uncharacterized protein YgiM (DUF1202 family)
MKIRHGFFLALALLIATTSHGQDATNAQPESTAATPAAPAKSTAKKTSTKKKSAQLEKEKAKAKQPALVLEPLSYPAIGTATVKRDNVNVRGRPSFKGEVVTRLKKGETVTLLEQMTLKKPGPEEPTNWFRISLPTNTPVWVFADFVDTTNKTVTASRLQVRGGPGENYCVVARLLKGEPIKEIRKVNDWIEIETPANAFGFVGAEFLEKQAAGAIQEAAVTPAPAPLPLPAPEVVTVPPAEEVKPASAEPAPPAEVPVPSPAPATDPAPAVAEAPAGEPEVLPKRMVKREGIVRKAWNIQAPAYFQLESIDRKKVINYVRSPEIEKVEDKIEYTVPKFNLEEYVGRRVLISGEESIDRRWKGTPVIEIESIDLQQ